MARSVDMERKPLLLAAILEHFEDKPLSSLSFRTLAGAVGVSTYALVYHFGTKEELQNEIVRAIAERQKSAETIVASDAAVSIEAHLTQLRESFEWTLQAENLKLQRLEFEAAMIEAFNPEQHTHTRKVFAFWMDETARTLEALGLDPKQAALESRILNNAFYGFQYDLVVNQDREGVREAFELMLERYREHLKVLLDR